MFFIIGQWSCCFFFLQKDRTMFHDMIDLVEKVWILDHGFGSWVLSWESRIEIRHVNLTLSRLQDKKVSMQQDGFPQGRTSKQVQGGWTRDGSGHLFAATTSNKPKTETQLRQLFAMRRSRQLVWERWMQQPPKPCQLVTLWFYLSNYLSIYICFCLFYLCFFLFIYIFTYIYIYL